MSRKQVGYEFRLFRVSAVDPTASRQELRNIIEGEYLAQGWEVLSAEVTKIDGNDVFVSFHLVKYVVGEDGVKSASK